MLELSRRGSFPAVAVCVVLVDAGLQPAVVCSALVGAPFRALYNHIM